MIEQLQPLIKRSLRRKFIKGSTILYQGEVPRSACVLASGTVKVFNISAQGDEQIVMFHIAGEFFPSSWIFGKAPSTLFFYEALEDCEVALMPRKDLIDFLLSKSESMHAMLDYFTTNYSASMIRINGLEQSKAQLKLVYTLYYLCQRYGNVALSKVTLPIALTHQTLASLVGLTRETTAIEMNRLKKKGILSYKQQHYTINIVKLSELIGEDSFRNIAIAS